MPEPTIVEVRVIAAGGKFLGNDIGGAEVTVRDATSMAEIDAYQFVTQTARASIIQLVDPEYTVLVKIDKARAPAK